MCGASHIWSGRIRPTWPCATIPRVPPTRRQRAAKAEPVGQPSTADCREHMTVPQVVATVGRLTDPPELPPPPEPPDAIPPWPSYDQRSSEEVIARLDPLPLDDAKFIFPNVLRYESNHAQRPDLLAFVERVIEEHSWRITATRGAP